MECSLEVEKRSENCSRDAARKHRGPRRRRRWTWKGVIIVSRTGHQAVERLSVSMSQDDTVQVNSVCLRGCEEEGDGCNACLSAVCPWCLSTRATPSPEQDAIEAQHYEGDAARHWRRASAVPPPCMGRRPFSPIPTHGWHGLGWMGWSFRARQCPPMPASRLHEDRIRGVCYL